MSAKRRLPKSGSHLLFMDTSKNLDFIPAAALREKLYVPGLTGDGIPCGLADLANICGAAKFPPRLAFGRALNF